MDRAPDSALSLQEMYGADTICFGCGPANPDGLHVRSFVAADGEVIGEWRPAAHHQAFRGVLNGGIIGTLLDCHCNWTAAHHLMNRLGRERPPTTVTADYAIRLLRPTPIDAPLKLRAHVVESTDERATVEGSIVAGGHVTATCRGTFVAVRPDHPAFNRW